MGFFDKGKQYWNLANNIGNIYELLKQTQSNFSGQLSEEDEMEKRGTAFVLGCLVYKNLYLKLEEYNWSLNTPISIPNIDKNTMSLQDAINRLNEQLLELIDTYEDNEIISDILEGGKYFEQLEKEIPPQLRNFK
jgi:hypothetical protein